MYIAGCTSAVTAVRHALLPALQEPGLEAAPAPKRKRSTARKAASPESAEADGPQPPTASPDGASPQQAQQQPEPVAHLTEAVVAPEFHLADAVVAEEAARPMEGSLGDGCREPLVLHYTSQGAPQHAHGRSVVQTPAGTSASMSGCGWIPASVCRLL